MGCGLQRIGCGLQSVIKWIIKCVRDYKVSRWITKCDGIIKCGGTRVFLFPKVVFNLKTIGNYMFKVNNRNTRIKCGICSKLIIKTLLILLLTLSKLTSS